METLRGWRWTGSRYTSGGKFFPGFCQAITDKRTIYLGDIKGIQPILDKVKSMGIDTTECQTRLDSWVKHGGEYVQMKFTR